jgi:hypothetical protein
MSLDARFHSLAREYVGLMMTDSATREELATWPSHEQRANDYHQKLREFVNRRLNPAEPLPPEAAADFHQYVYDSLDEFRKHWGSQFADEHAFEIHCDGYCAVRCI